MTSSTSDTVPLRYQNPLNSRVSTPSRTQPSASRLVSSGHFRFGLCPSLYYLNRELGWVCSFFVSRSVLRSSSDPDRQSPHPSPFTPYSALVLTKRTLFSVFVTARKDDPSITLIVTLHLYETGSLKYTSRDRKKHFETFSKYCFSIKIK